MDFTGAVTRLFNLYQLTKAKRFGLNGAGMYIQRYQTSKGIAFLYVILATPKKPTKGKQKDLQGVLEHSQNTNKLIVPKDFIGVRNYLSSIFARIIKPEAEILETLKWLIAGIRLEFVPYENLKYSFLDPSNPEILIYDEEKDGQFAFYINIINTKDSGLILAHERQISFIKEQLENGVNPIEIKNLPPLRTGQTKIDLKKKSSSPVKNAPKDGTVGHQKLAQVLHQRKVDEEKSKEIDAGTVFDSFGSDANKTPPTSTQEAPLMPRNKKGPPKSPTFFTSAPQKVDLPPFPPKETPTETTENNPLDQVKDLIAEDFPQFEGGTQKIAPFSSQMVDQLNEQVHQLEAENEILKQQNQDTTDHLTQTLQQKDEELSQIKEFFSQQNGEMAQYQESLQKVMDEMHEKDNQIEELNQKNQEIQTNLDFVSNQLTEFQEKIKEKEVIIQQISQENSQLDDNIEQFMNERTQLEENVTQLEKQMAEATAKSSSESEDRFLQLTEENEQLADALKESDRKYQILFEEHSKIVKAHLKDEYQTSPVDKSENDDPSNEDAIDN